MKQIFHGPLLITRSEAGNEVESEVVGLWVDVGPFLMI